MNSRKASRHRMMWVAVPVLVLTLARCTQETLYLCPVPSVPCDNPDAGADADANPEAGP